ncbi:MAG: O-antigen ligase family protein [Oligoflexia bacterium]|nr:O-antigen ligase family protein [Oligoflexia bacterium]
MNASQTQLRSTAVAWWSVAALGVVVGFVTGLRPTLSMALLVALGLVATGLTRPTFIVASIFLAMFFDRAGMLGVKVAAFPVTAAKLSVLSGLGLWGLRAGLVRERALRWHPVLSAMLGVVLSTGLCIAYANAWDVGKFDFFGLVMMMVMVGLVYAILADAPLENLVRLIGLVLVGALLYTLLYSLSSPGASGTVGRASGPMGDPNEWAAIVLLLSPLVLGHLVDDPHWMARPLRVAVLTLAPLGIFQTESRAALLVGALCVPCWVYLMRRRRGELIFCAVGAVAVLPLVGNLDHAWVRFSALLDNARGVAVVPDGSLDERAELFRQGVALFFDHWLLGAGPGTFSTATGFIPRISGLRSAHNTYLEIAGEQGLLGLGAMSIFGFTVARTLWRGLDQARDARSRNRVLGVTVGLVAVAGMAGTLGLLTFAMAYLVLGFSLALVHQLHAARA